MENSKRIVIVGATSAIAEHCARLWVQGRTTHVTLVGRDTRRLSRVASDLKARSPSSEIEVLRADFLDPAAIQSTVDSIAAHGPIDIALLAHGSLPDQGACQEDLRACRDALEVNAVSPVLYAEAFVGHMAQADRGTLAVIGSVAGDRGRKSNYVYGAAKGLLARYAQGLQHRFAKSGVSVVLIKPGPTATPMTAHLQGRRPRLAAPEDVAKTIVTGIDRRAPVIYAPGKWRMIMFVIRHLPRWLFERLNI